MPGFPILQNFKPQRFNTEPCNRLREAAKIPGRSLQMGVDSEPEDDAANDGGFDGRGVRRGNG